MYDTVYYTCLSCGHSFYYKKVKDGEICPICDEPSAFKIVDIENEVKEND